MKETTKAIIYIDPEIHRLAKIAAAREGTTIGRYVEQAIREMIENDRKNAQATGGENQ